MSAAKDPEGREHIGDEYVTYNRHQERRHRPDFPPFPPSSEEEEEAHREAERRAEREAEREAERMLRDRYERPEGSGKAPVDPEAAFMQVINDMLASQRTMLSSWHKWLIDWLEWAPQIHKSRMQHRGTREHVVDPSHPLAHTLLQVGFPDPCFPVSRGQPQ
jgi:hypothetical protein